MTIKVEYLLADYIGRVQRRFHSGDRLASLERRMAASRAIGRGARLAEMELAEVQDFAFSMWFRTGAACLGVLAVTGPVIAVLPRPVRHSVSFLFYVPGALMAMCLVQGIPNLWRRNWTSISANRRVAGLSVNPREERRGQPKARDFWIMLIISLGGSAVLVYASAHPHWWP